MLRMLLGLICAFGLLVAPAQAPALAMSNSTFDSQLRKYTNKARTDRDRAKLKFGKCVDRYAQRQANKMAAEKRMFHQDLSVVLRKCKAKRVAENVATGFESPRANVQAWLDSPGHRRNMLSRKYTHLGIGVARDSNGISYTAQVFAKPR